MKKIKIKEMKKWQNKRNPHTHHWPVALDRVLAPPLTPILVRTPLCVLKIRFLDVKMYKYEKKNKELQK